MFNLLITEPTPIRFQDRCEGVPFNIFTKGIQAETMGDLYDQINEWLITTDGITLAIYARVEGIIKALACDDVFQAGNYSFKFWRS